MQARRVTKAAVLPISAVIVSVVLALIVTQPSSVASSGHEASVKFTLKPIIAAAAPKTVPHLSAYTTESPLLPIVNQPDIRTNQQQIADTVLRHLPAGCRDNLKSFYVQYSNVKQRGLGGKSTIIIDGTAPDTEFAGLLVHECGHVIHGNWMGNAASGKSAFKDGNDIFMNNSPAAQFFAISWTQANILKKGQTKNDFVTGYAQSDAFEDFAETFATYVLQRPSMVERAKTNATIAAKLAWMQTNLPLADNLLGTPQYKWDKKVPWDATKLAYMWNPLAL